MDEANFWQIVAILQGLIDSLPQETLLVGALYLVLGGLYLLVVPAILYFYLQQRWYVAGSFERAFMYFMVFLYFPGMLLLSPFLNLRPRRRQLG